MRAKGETTLLHKKPYTRNASRILRKWMIAGWMLVIAGTSIVQSNDAGTRSRNYSSKGFSREILAAHNHIRAQVKLPPLQWSVKLADYSQQWANFLLARNRSGHNPGSPYGENVYVSGTGMNPATVVMEWASESRYYSYRTNSCSADCGHYTQLVWRDTQKVGCAVAQNTKRKIWVCSYDPPGNYRGEWPY